MASDSHLIYKTFPVGPLACNCTIIANTQTKKGIVVDPGGDAEKIIAIVNKLGISLEKIIHTHAHFDHILAAGILHEKTGAPIYLHKEDLFLWDLVEKQCQLFQCEYKHPLPQPHYYLKENQQLENGYALHTPGHSPGSMCFWFESIDLLVAGDTLFQGSIGRTDLWGGSTEQIQKSIKNKILTLSPSATVITGHGPNTSLEKEIEYNPFLSALI